MMIVEAVEHKINVSWQIWYLLA